MYDIMIKYFCLQLDKMLFLPLEFDKESGSMNLIAAVKLEIEMVPQNLLILLYFVKKDLDEQNSIWFIVLCCRWTTKWVWNMPHRPE